MPPKSKQSKQRTVRCRDDERAPGSCARGANCRFLHLHPSDPQPAAEASSTPRSATPEPFGFGNVDVERYRAAAMRIAKLRNAGNSSLVDIKNQLQELWEVTVCNFFPPTMSSALSQFHPQIQLEKLATKPCEWPQSSSIERLDPLVMDAVLSQLLLQRDFALGLLGLTASTASDMLNFLARDAIFLRSLQCLLSTLVPYPLQPTSCMPTVIRNLIASEPLFLEIMLQLLPPFRDDQNAAVPERITQGAHLCHLLQHSFGFDIQDLKPLYLRLMSNPLSSFSGAKHAGEWRAVTESPPQRYNLRGEPQGRITKYCVDDEENEGVTCMHRRLGPDREVLRRDHWSCCGGSDKNDMSCVNSGIASKLRSVGLQCALSHPLTVRVCLTSSMPLPVDVVCIVCGVNCYVSSCVSTFCSVCKEPTCLACTEVIGKEAGPGAALVSMRAFMNASVAAFIDDHHSGAGYLLTRLLCHAFDNKRMHPRDIHTIHLLLASLDIDSRSPNDDTDLFDRCECRLLAGAVAAALARQQPSSYPDPDIPIDLRVKQQSSSKAAAAAVPAAIPYLDPLLKFISQTKRYNEFADAMIKKIQEEYPTPAELLSLIAGDKSRLLVALEVAWFECKHPASKSKGAILAQLLEMGCFPRKFAVKAVLKRSRAEEAVNYFFSESKTASDEDESEDAVLTNTDQVSEALKSFVALPVLPPKDSDDKALAVSAQLTNFAEIEAKVNFAQLLETLTTTRSALENVFDLKELVFPLLNGMYDRVEAMALQQKSASASPHVSESELRLLLQSLMQSCSHARSAALLRCFAGHALVLESCPRQARCTLCSLPLPTSVQRFGCSILKSGSKTSKQCDFGICVTCAKEHTHAQSALYSPFDIMAAIHALERIIPHGKLHERMKLAFSSIASSPEYAFAPIVLFGWKSPDIPRSIVPSGDICGPDCSREHTDESAICIRCDRRYSSHKGHLCNDGERGYFIVSQTENQGQSPLVQGPQGSHDIDMRYSSDRPISLVHSEGLFAGRKWTCTLASTSERGRNTWIGLCDADVIAQYVGSADFKGLGTRANGFSIGIHHELGVRLSDKTTLRSFSCKDGEGITLEYDEPGRKLDVVIGKRLVYSHAGLPPNLVFAISSGDKKSKFAAVKCRQIDAPIHVDVDRCSLLDGILKAIEDTETWNADGVFSLLSFLSMLRTKPHYILCSKFLRPLQVTLLRCITKMIECDELNAATSRVGACDWIFTELTHAIELNRKALLLAIVVQLKQVSIALLQGRNNLSSDSLSFLSKIFAVCSKGFAHTTAAAFDFLVKCVADLGESKSILDYVPIPRWVIEAIDPSRSFVSVYNLGGTCFPAVLHAGWFDMQTKDGKSVRLSCEAAQLLLHRLQTKETAADMTAPVLKIGCVAASAEKELANNGLHELHSDSDIGQTPLQTASLPNSIHIGSNCIDAVVWFKSQLRSQKRVDTDNDTSGGLAVGDDYSRAHGPSASEYLFNPRTGRVEPMQAPPPPSTAPRPPVKIQLNEIEALAACCKDTGSAPAIVQSVLTDLVRRGFVVRAHGCIALAEDADIVRRRRRDAACIWVAQAVGGEYGYWGSYI